MASETTIQIQVADYLVLHYPDVIFHSDYGSGLKLNKVQAALQKRLNGGRKSYPDMFIAECMPRCLNGLGSRLLNGEASGCSRSACEVGSTPTRGANFYAGLYLELKKDGTKLIREKDARKFLKDDYKWRKKGDWWDLHIEEQANMLEKLREKGYCAEFAVGLEGAKKIIDQYLGGHKDEKVEF